MSCSVVYSRLVSRLIFSKIAQSERNAIGIDWCAGYKPCLVLFMISQGIKVSDGAHVSFVFSTCLLAIELLERVRPIICDNQSPSVGRSIRTCVVLLSSK